MEVKDRHGGLLKNHCRQAGSGMFEFSDTTEVQPCGAADHAVTAFGTDKYNFCGNPKCRCKASSPRKQGPFYQLSYTRKRRRNSLFVQSNDLANREETKEDLRSVAAARRPLDRPRHRAFEHQGRAGQSARRYPEKRESPQFPYLLTFLRAAATPTSPRPRRSMVAGSGTLGTWLYSTTYPSVDPEVSFQVAAWPPLPQKAR